jgi:hypothetical protein
MMPVRHLDGEPTRAVVMSVMGTEAPLPPSEGELTDVDSARQYMQQNLNNKLQDEDVETLIFQVTDAFTRHTNREFFPSSATRSFEWVQGRFDVLDLAPYEIRTATKVQLDPETEGGTELTDYRLRPCPARDGTFFQIRLTELPAPKASANPSEFPFYTRRLDIAGEWGMAKVPDIIQHYANVTVKAWAELRHEVGLPPNAEFGEGAPLRAENIPIAVLRGLDVWKRPEALV